MCITPCMVPEVGPVACRYCWQCRKNRVNDLVGRCIAESYHSTETLAVTLTYSDDALEQESRETGENRRAHAATLVYADFQRFMKRLRKAGYAVRYIVAGEYGSRKGRAHWHAILFFQGKAPQVVGDPEAVQGDEVALDCRINWPHWTAGYSYFQRPDYGGFAYLLKYVLKDTDQAVARHHLAMSKKPPLGAEYFRALALQHVEENISPQTALYVFRDQFDGKQQRREFMLQGRMREIYVETFLEAYKARYDRPYPQSEFLEEQQDRLLRRETQEIPFEEFAKKFWAQSEYDRQTIPRQSAARLAKEREAEKAAEVERIGQRVLKYVLGWEDTLVAFRLDGKLEIKVDGNKQSWTGDAKSFAEKLSSIGAQKSQINQWYAWISQACPKGRENLYLDPDTLRNLRE